MGAVKVRGQFSTLFSILFVHYEKTIAYNGAIKLNGKYRVSYTIIYSIVASLYNAG